MQRETQMPKLQTWAQSYTSYLTHPSKAQGTLQKDKWGEPKYGVTSYKMPFPRPKHWAHTRPTLSTISQDRGRDLRDLFFTSELLAIGRCLETEVTVFSCVPVA